MSLFRDSVLLQGEPSLVPSISSIRTKAASQQGGDNRKRNLAPELFENKRVSTHLCNHRLSPILVTVVKIINGTITTQRKNCFDNAFHLCTLQILRMSLRDSVQVAKVNLHYAARYSYKYRGNHSKAGDNRKRNPHQSFGNKRVSTQFAIID
ncbi:hypothetical protein CEXT_539721 [Caerostris extrusa]|uniref:Uncharacterized protein n=1 Tax=Caerostris extrusa TaxID=172846 RepID=A0AAV4W587_CAEEX|nr:hypothetical protein CEXT_539721 [Caerostris extrusa]